MNSTATNSTNDRHTPGPWELAQSLFPCARPFSAYRDGGLPTFDVMRDRRGNERRFATETAALAAIAKANGSAA